MPAADVTETSAGYERRIRQWRKVRDAIEGEERIKDRGTLYLPKPRGMHRTDYANYVERGNFYGVADRTLRGLTGLVFRVDPVLELPDKLEPLRGSMTSEGFTANQVLREGVREILSLGRYGVLVDMAAAPSATGLPYLATYKAEDIFRWEERTIDGQRKLVRVVVREEEETSDEETRVILRELAIEDGVYVQRVFEEVETERDGRSTAQISRNEDTDFISGQFQQVGEDVIPRVQGRPFSDIPFWFVNVYDLRPRTDKPPMLDLVHVNLAHWRNSCDYEHGLYLTGNPTPFVFGIPKQDKPKAIGAGTIWHSENKDVKAGFLEFTGQGLEPLRQGMRDKEDRMAELGARVIKDVERDNVTAETTRLQTRAETSILVAGVDSVTEAFQKALEFAAFWAGADQSEVSLGLNSDFIETRLGPEELKALVASWQTGAISRQTLHEQLQEGEIIPPDRSLDQELEFIEQEGDGMGAPAARPPVPGAPPPAPEPEPPEPEGE